MKSIDPADYQRTRGPAAIMPKTFAHGAEVAAHTHRRNQLIWAETGVMHVRAEASVWVVSPQRALWVPAGLKHALRMVGKVHMRTLYVEPSATTQGAPAGCKLVLISPLMRELILDAARWPLEYRYGNRLDHVLTLILDELSALKAQPLRLPLPKDSRLLRLCEALITNPASQRTLEQWAYDVGASSRTLARLFARETGMRFVDWRNQARLARAVTLIANKASVADVAHRLGYASPSAFTAMMRRTLGCVPRDLV
jgi:AraC-like DNA-binding protein